LPRRKVLRAASGPPERGQRTATTRRIGSRGRSMRSRIGDREAAACASPRGRERSETVSPSNANGDLTALAVLAHVSKH